MDEANQRPEPSGQAAGAGAAHMMGLELVGELMGSGLWYELVVSLRAFVDTNEGSKMTAPLLELDVALAGDCPVFESGLPRLAGRHFTCPVPPQRLASFPNPTKPASHSGPAVRVRTTS